MKNCLTNLKNKTPISLGYPLGFLASIFFLFLISKIKLVRWIVTFIPQDQVFLKIVGGSLVLGIVLAISGAIIGGVGGWFLNGVVEDRGEDEDGCKSLQKGVDQKGSNKKVLTKKYAKYKSTISKKIIRSSAIAFAVSVALLTQLFLVFSGFVALYNNFNVDKFEKFGAVFGLFGLIFGLVTGVLFGLFTTKVRYAWRVAVSSVVGFTTGGVVFGVLLKYLNPTAGFKTYPILTFIILMLAMMVPFLITGFLWKKTYSYFVKISLGKNGSSVDSSIDSTLKGTSKNLHEVWAGKKQVGVVVFVLVLLVVVFLGFMSDITRFLVIDPAPTQEYIESKTVGVAWSEPVVYEQNNSGLPVVSPSYSIDKNNQSGHMGDSRIMIMSSNGDTHDTWCGKGGLVYYQFTDAKLSSSEVEEVVSTHGCVSKNISGNEEYSKPSIVLDNDGKAHVFWYTHGIEDTNGFINYSGYIVESIRDNKPSNNENWSDPLIISKLDNPTNHNPIFSTKIEDGIYISWLDGEKYYSSVQKEYKCDESILPNIALVGMNAVINNGNRDGLSSFPYCQNEYDKFYYTPNPNQEVSHEEVSENGAFDRAGELINEAKYEVLFATMQYEANNTPPSPGTTLVKAVVDLYNKVEANPEDYPRGMTVKILLGNYPEMSDFTWGDQIYFLLEDLEKEGLPAMINEDIGWRLEVANFAGAYPHSHSKFMVVDGKTTVATGYNYGYLHLPKDHESGRGFDLFDLGLQVTGPVAQDSMSAFDDLWYEADRVHCEGLGSDQDDGDIKESSSSNQPGDSKNSDWRDTCVDSKAVVNHVPEVLRSYIPEGLGEDASDDLAFSLYRTSDSKEADIFIATSMAAAEESIDMVHVNFSLEAICSVNVVLPGFCTADDSLLWMKSLMSSIEKNHTKVRVIMENSNMNGIENRVGSNVFLEELEERGLSEYVELRFDSGKIHAKSILMDDELLVVGSQNMHYSAWGEGGLTEYSIATTSQDAIEEYKAVFESHWENAVPFEDAEYGMTP